MYRKVDAWREQGERGGARGALAKCLVLPVCQTQKKWLRGRNGGRSFEGRAWGGEWGMCVGTSLPTGDLRPPPSDVSVLPLVGGCMQWSRSSQVASQSFLFIFRWCKKSKSPFIATDPYSYLMLVVLIGSWLNLLSEATRDSKSPKRVEGLESEGKVN